MVMAVALTWTDLWAECTERLGSSDEARRIVEQASGRAGASWLITLTTTAPTHAIERVHEMVRRRLDGEPLQYVLGRWQFRQLDLHVDKRVLIPRPETEQVVSAALEVVAGIDQPVVVDLGTGSGAIALSIAFEAETANVWATDVSLSSLEVAAQNLGELPEQVIERVKLCAGSWFDPLPDTLKGTVDLIVSNPPYVTDQEWATLDPVVRDWEPKAALTAGDEGLDSIVEIFHDATHWLKPGGVIIVEIAPQQERAVRKLALTSGFVEAIAGTDFADRKRWVLATKGE